MSDAALQARQTAADAQRPAADPAASVWVAASAGTGKTKVLTDRVLSLMLHGTPPERILCLTFTKAAAAEMATRLAGRLARWATMKDDRLAEDLHDLLGDHFETTLFDEARRLFARVLDAPGGMKIQTIHAFCQSLLGRFPLEARVAPHFQVLDERSAAEMLHQAREEVLAAARAEMDGDATGLADAVAEVSIHAQEQTFTELMAGLVKERGQLVRLLRRHGGPDGLEAAVYRVLAVDPGDTAEGLLAAASADTALDVMGLHLVVEALGQGTDPERKKAAALGGWLAADMVARTAGFDDYSGLFLTKAGEVRSRLLTKGAQAAVPGALTVMEAEAVRLIGVRDRLNALAVARATAALLHLGAAILEAYQRHKTARALLDYDDLILGTRDLLARQGSASWVLYKLDGGLDHVLIDEAQDTNPEQWEVIDSITAEFFAGEGAHDAARTVFAVGDAKQSIYSFQRADPTAFGRMREHFRSRAREAGQHWTQVDLAHSFRSSAAVLEAVDALFAQEVARAGVLFEEEDLQHQAVRLGQAGLVELWPPVPPAETDETTPEEPPVARRGETPPRTRLARLIARKVRSWTATPDGGDGAEGWLASKGRRLRPGDILVLVRRRNEFVEELVRELKRLDVPVAGVDRMVLRDQLAVMDLVALGRVLLLPEDDLTLATVLKGPLLGLSEDQLFQVAYDRDGSLWSALAARATHDPDLRAARRHLADLMARADFVRPYELYADILTRDWGGGRGRERLLARLGPDAEDPIEEFLSLALAYEREHVPSLEGFLHWIEAGAQEVKRDMEHGPDAVRVMTVHGAKGLQAPVVILPDTMQTPPAQRGVFWLDGDDPLALWPLKQAYDGAVAKAARGRAQAAQDEEYHRLLYVAMTRAEDRLYVCGWSLRTAASEHCWYKLVERALAGAGEAVHVDFTGDIEEGWAGPGARLSTSQSADPEPDAAQVMPAVRTDAALPPWIGQAPRPEPAPPRPLAPSRPAMDEPPVLSPLGPDEGRRFRRGRLIHRLLQTLPELPSEDRRAAAERLLASPAHGLPSEDRSEIADAALTVLEDPDFAHLFGVGSRAEVPLVGVAQVHGRDEVISGQVDRLIVDERYVLIVDYKTNRPAPTAEAEVPAVYLRQMAAYRAVLSGLYPDRRIDCALLWTDGPHLMQLSDAALAGQAP